MWRSLSINFLGFKYRVDIDIFYAAAEKLTHESKLLDSKKGLIQNTSHKGPVKLIQRVKIAHSFLQSVSNLFHFIILSSYM